MLRNYEMVQKGFTILHPLMAAYIEQQFKCVWHSEWWMEVLAALDDQYDLLSEGSDDELRQSLDIVNCLRLIDRRWQKVFRIQLSIDYRYWAKELMGVRNKCAHIGTVDFDQTYAERALDTMARLCEAFDQEGMNALRDIYRTIRYGSEEGSKAMDLAGPIGKTKTNSGVLTGQLVSHLPSWRDVIQPHPDVAQGRYRIAEFAADLAQVARGEGEFEYRDPVEFFARTYVTQGMKGLLLTALKRLDGQGGEPVIQLKTAFGGGKTHSMLALYHLVRGGLVPERIPAVTEILREAGLERPPVVPVAVLVGTAMAVDRRRNPADLPGHTVATMWGDLAYQLAIAARKPRLYDQISAADRKGVTPGSQCLKTFFDEIGPCLILMDEIVAYARKLYGRNDLPAGTYDNFLVFIQELTEAAKASKQCLVVASLPESDLEIGGEAGHQALRMIENTFGRMETVWKPVAPDEGFEIVRRRLFLPCHDEARRDQICNAFSRMYQENAKDFPSGAKELSYRDRMISCYPIHPEIFDRLYQDWSTLEKFQRTRGVLRLMAAVIYELWMANDAEPMIMPGSFPLNRVTVKNELTRHLPETWNSIVDSEVDGDASKPFIIDRETARYGKKLAARRVARTIMLGSAPGTAALKKKHMKGVTAQTIHLGVVQPGESIADFNDALSALLRELSYLYSSETSFWFDVNPTLKKTVDERKLQIKETAVNDEIERRLLLLRRSADLKTLHVCPVSSSDIPDEQSARLVILRPADAYVPGEGGADCAARRAVEKFITERGSSPRIFRNMLLFIAPDRDKLDDLKEEVRLYLAWASINEDKADLNLDNQQEREAEASTKRAGANVERNLKEAYCWLMTPFIDLQKTERGKISWEVKALGGGDIDIVTKAMNCLKQNELVIFKWSPQLLTMSLNEFLWRDHDHIEVGLLFKDLCSYCYLPRLASYAVLEETILSGTDSPSFFALAAGCQDDEYVDLTLGIHRRDLHMSDLLIKPAVAEKQLARQRTPVVPPQEESVSSSVSSTPVSPVFEKPLHRSFRMKVRLDNLRINRDVERYYEEICRHLCGIPGADVDICLEVEAYVPDGMSKDVERTILENCSSLKIQEFSFKDD